MIAHHCRYDNNQDNLGYKERLKHIDMIKAGAKCYMLMCLVKDVNASPREIESINEKDVFVGGDVIEQNGNTYIELVDRYAINKIT